MRLIHEILKFKTIKNIKMDNALGRWNLKDNREIKAALANMDCCGDDLCGKPQEYKQTINVILKKSDNIS